MYKGTEMQNLMTGVEAKALVKEWGSFGVRNVAIERASRTILMLNEIVLADANRIIREGRAVHGNALVDAAWEKRDLAQSKGRLF